MIINKWKGKSIYQIVLLDRANKLQDVVYFSLQVSLNTYYYLSKYNLYWPSHRHRTNIIFKIKQLKHYININIVIVKVFFLRLLPDFLYSFKIISLTIIYY